MRKWKETLHFIMLDLTADKLKRTTSLLANQKIPRGIMEQKTPEEVAELMTNHF